MTLYIAEHIAFQRRACHYEMLYTLQTDPTTSKSLTKTVSLFVKTDFLSSLFTKKQRRFSTPKVVQTKKVESLFWTFSNTLSQWFYDQIEPIWAIL